MILSVEHAYREAMRRETIQTLNRLNSQFYETTAISFDRLRHSAWQGWDRLLPYLQPKITVLDVGCGNGRLGIFLARRLGTQVQYHGLDNSPVLIERARQSLTDFLPDARLDLRDVVEQPPDDGLYDLAAAFGVLHHVPGYAQRLDMVRRLAQRVAPGGLLAFASWRFYEYERFRDRIVPWPADLECEPGDYLINWQRDSAVLRYCHYSDDAEQSALVAASGLTELDRYRADGDTKDINCYSLLRKER